MRSAEPSLTVSSSFVGPASVRDCQIGGKRTLIPSSRRIVRASGSFCANAGPGTRNAPTTARTGARRRVGMRPPVWNGGSGPCRRHAQNQHIRAEMPRRAGLLGELEPLVRDLEGLDGDVGGAGDSEDVRQETQLEPAVNVRPDMGDHAGAQAPSPASEDSVQDTENRDL